MRPFAVQLITPGASQPQFLLVAAESPEEAAAVAARKMVDEGHPEVNLIAVFDRAEAQSLADALTQAEQELAG